MAKQRGHQKGPQGHAEGQQGRKTHTAFLEGRHGRHGGGLESEGAPQENGNLSAHVGESDGKHRLFEGREQHDEASKNSETSRRAKKGIRDNGFRG